MHPILLHFGPLTIRTYGVLVALAFLLALQVVRVAGARRGLPEADLMDLVALLVLSGLLGARLFYVALSAGYFVSHPWEVFKIWEGGLVFYGGFITAAVAGFIFVRRRRLSLANVADCLAPGIAIGQAIGRWGCFFAGCCYGRASSLPWAVEYQDPASLAPLGIRMHPVQIYESIGDGIIALVLWIRLMRGRETRGEVFWLYVLLYGALRFGMEILRGDDRGPTWGGLYPSQIIAILAMLVASSILLARVASNAQTTGHS